MESPSFLSPHTTSGTVSSSDYNSDYTTDMYGSTPTLKNNNANANSVSQRSSKKSVSTFIQKLYSMLESDPQNNISWTPSGTSFIVNNAKEFAANVLPTHFKHSNFSSFVRLLNMYGFHKISKSPRSQRSNDNELWEFSHTKFIRDRPDLLKDIKRKTMDSEMMRRETSDIQASFARLQMSQADIIQQFSTLQESFTSLLSGLEETRKIQQQQSAQISQLSQQQGQLLVNDALTTNFNGQKNPLDNQLSPYTGQQQQQRHRRTTSTPSLSSNGTMQQPQYLNQQQQQQQSQMPRFDEPFRMMVTTPSSSSNNVLPNQTDSLDSNSYWMNKSTRSFSHPPDILGNTNNDTSNTNLSRPIQQQQLQQSNVLFSPMTFQSAVNTPLPPSPMMLTSPDLAISPGSSEESLGSYVFNLGQANTLDPSSM